MIKTATGGCISRDDAIAACNSYVGLPVVDCGDTREGVNCLGLVVLFYREQFGIVLSNPTSQSTAEILASPLAGHFAIEREAAFGSVVMLPGTGEIDHVGIWTPLGVLHARERSHSVVLTLAKHLQIRAIYGPVRGI